MKAISEICQSLRGKLIVSCQASTGDAFRDSAAMARFARAAVDGGAAGIRAEGVEDVQAIRAAVAVPIIGVRKSQAADGRILITPSVEAARDLIEAGADLIALDCTTRGQRYGALERLQRIKTELQVPALADIATVEEAIIAAAAGADFVLSTLRGYTPETEQCKTFEPEFIAALRSAVKVPIIAEGRIWTPDEARAAMMAGAFAVIAGAAITRPHEITRRFASALEPQDARRQTEDCLIGIDVGGTNIKYGLVSRQGELLSSSVIPTPADAGRDFLLKQLKIIAQACLDEASQRDLKPAGLGVATAGWVNPATGEVIYSTGNIAGWTGTQLARELGEATGLRVVAENDANALAVAENHFGAARDVDNFVCLTLGTGVGGGCYSQGKLLRGARGLANALGHIRIEHDGRSCTCGSRGCLEAYANAAALVRYAAAGSFSSAQEVISAANAGDPIACNAIQTLAHYLAAGCASIIRALDPALLILSGGLTQNNPLLLISLEQELMNQLPAAHWHNLQIRYSQLGYFGGALGAAAVLARSLDLR